MNSRIGAVACSVVALVTVALSVGAPARVAAQQKESGAFVALIGKDTLAFESFTRTGAVVTGRSVLRGGVLNVRDYRIEYAPDGKVASYAVRTFPIRNLEPQATNNITTDFSDVNGNKYKPAANISFKNPSDTAPGTYQLFEYRGDSAYVTMKQGTNARNRVIASAGNSLPFSENIFAPWMESVRRTGSANSLTLLAGGNAMRYTIERPAAGRMTLGGVADNDFGPMELRVDTKGNMMQLDMRATTDKYLVNRVASLNMDNLIADFAKRPLGALSPRDTARAAVGGASVAIDYSKPSARGRVVFGGMEKWGTVWRAGADQATQLITDRDIVIAGTTVPAGTHSLFVQIAQNGEWQLIINNQKGQWGTVYDKAQDLVRVPVRATEAPAFTEQLRFQIAPSSAGGTIRMTWENTTFVVPFTVR